MANLLFTRTENSNSVPFVDGQIIIDETSGKISLDSVKEDEDKRIEVGGRMTVDSNLDKKSDNPIQNKAVANALIESAEAIRLTNQTGKIASALAVKQLEADLKANFQNGVDSVYNACVVAGATPKSKSVTDIVNAIGKISQVYYLGEGTSFDIKSVFPDDYQKLTKDNFIVCSVGGTVIGRSGYTSSYGIKNFSSHSVNYNNNSGMLTLSFSTATADVYYGNSSADWGRGEVNLNPPKVYLVTNGISPLQTDAIYGSRTIPAGDGNTSTNHSISIGFKPRFLILYQFPRYENTLAIYIYDENLSTTTYKYIHNKYNGYKMYDLGVGGSLEAVLKSINEDGFTLNYSDVVSKQISYIAFK